MTNTGKLTSDQRQKISTWIKTKVKDKDMECPICSHIYWTTTDRIIHIQVDDKSIMPVFVIICQNCGHTLIQNAIAAGVMPPDQPNE